MKQKTHRLTSKIPTFPLLIEDYCGRSMLLLTNWFAPPAARKLIFIGGGRRIIFEFATALQCFAKRLGETVALKFSE
jgi:hypothetical protein